MRHACMQTLLDAPAGRFVAIFFSMYMTTVRRSWCLQLTRQAGASTAHECTLLSMRGVGGL